MIIISTGNFKLYFESGAARQMSKVKNFVFSRRSLPFFFLARL
jgi:hypothetical protein